MIVQTRNHRYLVQDKGDGGFLVSGHPRYCPTPVLCTILTEPTVGSRMYFAKVDSDRVIITTPVVSINP